MEVGITPSTGIRSFSPKLQTRGQEIQVTAEFIDDKTFDPSPLFLAQQLQGAHQEAKLPLVDVPTRSTGASTSAIPMLAISPREG
jgi:hypothetical protein